MSIRAPHAYTSSSAAFFGGAASSLTSVFFVVMIGTFIGIGALAHGYGFSAWWLTASTVVVWAGPAQVILISALGGGGAMIDVAIAVSLSGVRLFPMVVSLLPLLRGENTRTRHLLLPSHFMSVTTWVESLRLLPALPHEQRIAFCNGLSSGYMATAVVTGLIGFYLAASLPPLLAGGLLFITPLAFLCTTARNARQLLDRLALVLGLSIEPVLTYFDISLDLVWTGVGAGTLAYVVHRVREASR
jgi:predicted branched-subunit amino acid permease